MSRQRDGDIRADGVEKTTENQGKNARGGLFGGDCIGLVHEMTNRHACDHAH